MRKLAGKRALSLFLSVVILGSVATLGSQAARADDRYPTTFSQPAASPAAAGRPERFVDPLAPPQDAAPLSRASYVSHPRGRKAAQVAAGPGAYFIEFRSRYALSYGHTYAAFGRLNSRGQIVSREVARHPPARDTNGPRMLGPRVARTYETGPRRGVRAAPRGGQMACGRGSGVFSRGSPLRIRLRATRRMSPRVGQTLPLRSSRRISTAMKRSLPSCCGTAAPTNVPSMSTT